MRVRAGGIMLACDDIGEGEAVLFVHGFPHHRALWAPQMRTLRTRCRCIAPDLRGFGESAVAPPYSMDRYADDLARLLAALGVERATVVGLSMGGYIALAFWRRHAAHVRALVLADTRAGADDAAARARRLELAALARERGAEAVADAMLPGMAGKSTRERQPELMAALRAMLASAPVDGIVGALQAMMERPDSTPTLATITVPTLVIVGDEDVLTPPAEAERLHAGIAGSRLAVIPGAGHVSNLERPSAFTAVTCELLESLAATS